MNADRHSSPAALVIFDDVELDHLVFVPNTGAKKAAAVATVDIDTRRIVAVALKPAA